MASLTGKLKELVKQSPSIGLDNAKRKLLHIPEESSEEIASDDESYDRKMAEKKKRKRKRMIAERKRLQAERELKI